MLFKNIYMEIPNTECVRDIEFKTRFFSVLGTLRRDNKQKHKKGLTMNCKETECM